MKSRNALLFLDCTLTRLRSRSRHHTWGPVFVSLCVCVCVCVCVTWKRDAGPVFIVEFVADVRVDPVVGVLFIFFFGALDGGDSKSSAI